MTRSAAILLLLSAACGGPGSTGPDPVAGPEASEATWPEADSFDVSTLEGVLTAYYDVVSGPAGQSRDWARDKSLHVPGALVVITRTGPEGTTVMDRMSISEYHARQPGPASEPFYEREIHRVVQRHGSTVHVWSTYEHSREADGEARGRGVNSIELVWDGSRYWITSWTYDGRGDAPPVPAEYLPE